MSLAINVAKVAQVLLADGWHHCNEGSFTLDSYEYLEYADNDPRDEHTMVLHGGGQSGICATGYEFVEGPFIVRGPLTAILGTREKQ